MVDNDWWLVAYDWLVMTGSRWVGVDDWIVITGIWWLVAND